MMGLMMNGGKSETVSLLIYVRAFALTALLFLLLPYVHLLVPAPPPILETVDISLAPIPDPPPLPPPVQTETHEQPPEDHQPILPVPSVSAAPLEPVLDFDFALNGVGGDFSLAFSVEADVGPVEGTAVYELGDVDRVPQAMAQMRPFYPAHARRRRIEGEVSVLFTVNVNGRTQDIEVLSSTPDDVFTAAAVRSVSRWRFSPALKAGRPVPVRVRQVIRFKMED